MPLALIDYTEPMSKAERADLKREAAVWKALEDENKRMRAALDAIEGQAVCAGMDGPEGNERMLINCAAIAHEALNPTTTE